MAISFSVTNNSEEFLKALGEQVEAALEECGLVAEGYAKKKCPVDTGRLRNSISHTTHENAAYIGTNVEYAPYVELGTSRMKPQPYLKPAVENHKGVYKSIIQKHLTK